MLIATLLSPQVFSAPPIAFGSTNCPAGFVCEDSVVSDGMLQRKIIDNSGSTFYHVSISDGVINNGGRFTYDSYVNATDGSTNGGISSRLDILETGEFNLDYTTILNLGWANDGNSAVDFSQTVTDNYQGVGFDYTFDYQQTQSVQGTATGFYYGIYQRLVDAALLTGNNDGGQDISTFVLRRAAGEFVSSGSVSLGGGGGGMGGGGGGGGGGGMGKAVLGSVSSNGVSSAATATLQNTFVPDASGYGTDGISSGVIGDAQTEPGPGAEYGTSTNPTFTGDPNGLTVSLNESNVDNYVNTTSRSTGNTTSDGFASGPAAPTTEVFVATGSESGMMDSGGPGGGTVSWNTGDEIQVLWIGQYCPGCRSSGGGGGGSFSFQQYENLTTGSAAAARSISTTSPLNWLTDPFGAQPGL